MIIYNRSGSIIKDIAIDDTSYRYRAIMGKNDVELHFSLSEYIEIPVGSYIRYSGEQYTLWYPENLEKKGTRHFEYTVTFISNKEMLKKYKYKLLTSSPYELKFSLTAKPIRFLQLLAENLNRHDSGWSIGPCIDTPEKTLAFNCDSCMDVLNRLASEFETEWDITDKTISLCKVERKGNPLELSYGKGNGFKSGVGRTSQGDKQPCTVLYVQGGEKNIDFSTYKSKTLLLPESQEFTYEGRMYKTDADCMFITRADKELTNYVEDGFDGSNFHPKRVGTVTTVIEVDENGKDIVKEEQGEGSEEGEEEEKPEVKTIFYDFTDTDIPDDLDYSTCRINGEKATIIFQSGILAGKEFDLVQTENDLTGYIHEKRRFKIVPQEYDGVMMPSGDTFKIRPGDTYAVFNISLPTAYVCNNETQTGASWEMYKEAVRYFYEHEDECFTFKGDLNGIWAKKHWKEMGHLIQLGGYVSFSDTQFQPQGILIRITGVRDYLNKPHSPQLELSNAPISGTVSSELGKLEGDEVITDNQHEEGLNFTKRRFRDAKETIKMLENAFLNFSGSIDPIAIRTMQLLVGDESLQFRFVNNKTNPETVPHVIKYDAKKKVFNVPAGIIQHMTLGVKSISSEHKPKEYRFWDMAEYPSRKLTEALKSYYLYARVSRTIPTGDFILSETAIKMEAEADTYHLLVGVLNSEYNGERSFVELYGFTEVLPGRITTDRVVSSDGLNFLDFVNNSFRVGNDKNYMDFNSKKDGKLRLKGSIIQSESGDEAPPGCFRGVWDRDATYFNGDEVTYNDGNGVSTYRYIAEIPGTRHYPTDKTYWTLIASGGRPGNDGYDGEDGKGIEFIFKLQNLIAPPETPESINTDDSVPDDWTDDQQGVTGLMQYEFVSRRVKSGGSWGRYSDPALWAKFSFDGEDGADGKDGTDHEYIFTRTTDNTKPKTQESINTDDAVPDGWTDDMAGVSSTYQYEWASKRTKSDGKWGPFCEPALWAKYSFDGVDGDYFEYRFAKNGSRNTAPDLDVTVSEPEGWSVIMPSTGLLEYLWFTIAKKTSSGELLQEWSIPKRMTPVDGVDGAPGTPAPILVFRGDYDYRKKYYGTSKRVDAVKYNNIHYVARTDAPADDSGCFSEHAPVIDTSKEDPYWNTFGAEYESVATNLLLADNANIGNWFMSGGKIVSTLDSKNKITLDALNSYIQIESEKSGTQIDQNDQGTNTDMGCILKIDATKGMIEARAKSDSGSVASISPAGIFCNSANTNGATFGLINNAAIVGLGYGYLDKEDDYDNNFLCGVYGRAKNKGTAPAYGGYFNNLMAAGLLLNVRTILNTYNNGVAVTGNHYLYNTDTMVIGGCSIRQNVYLPADGFIGQTIFFKQWQPGYMMVYPRGGQYLYDDSTENSSLDIGEGWSAICVFTRAYINGIEKQSWLISKTRPA